MPSQEEMAWKPCGALLLDRLVSWLHPGTEDRDGHSFAGPPKGESYEERQKTVGLCIVPDFRVTKYTVALLFVFNN